MDHAVFEKFDQECSEKLADEISKILKAAEGKRACAVGFITTDDLQGFYLTWDYSSDIEAYFNWENGLTPDFLYQPLVDAVEACDDIDFCSPSKEKWEFVQALLAVLEKNIRQIPDDVFHKYGFKRADLLFFAAMGDGDYVQEMLELSVKMFNTRET